MIKTIKAYSKTKYIIATAFAIISFLSLSNKVFAQNYSEIASKYGFTINNGISEYLSSNGITPQDLQYLIKAYIIPDTDEVKRENTKTNLTRYQITSALESSKNYITNKTGNTFKHPLFNPANQQEAKLAFTETDIVLNQSYTTEINITECFTNAATNPFASLPASKQPIGFIGTEFVDIFGNTVGYLKATETNDKTIYNLYINNQNTGLQYKETGIFSQCPVPDDYRNKTSLAYSCYPCKFIEIAFDAISITASVIFKEIPEYIIMLMVLLGGIYIMVEYYKNITDNIEKPFNKNMFKKLFIRMITCIAAIFILFNINNTVLYYFFKPITWASISISNAFLSENNSKININSKCEYDIQKANLSYKNRQGIGKLLPGLAYSGASPNSRNIFSDKSQIQINMTNEVICSFFRIEQQARIYRQVGWILLGQGLSNLIQMIQGLLLIIFLFGITAYVFIYYIEVVLMIGIGLIAIPFSLLGWAIPLPIMKNWKNKTIAIFVKASIQIFVLSITIVIIGAFLSKTILGIDVIQLQNLLLSYDYNKIIILNLIEAQTSDLYSLIRIFLSGCLLSYILAQAQGFAEGFANMITGGEAYPSSGLTSKLTSTAKTGIKKLQSVIRKKIP